MKELLLIKDNNIRLPEIFNESILNSDFSTLEQIAYRYLEKYFPYKVKKHIVIYNQLSPNLMYYTGRSGDLTIIFKEYSIYIFAITNAAKLLGIEIKLRFENDNDEYDIYLR